MSKLMESPALIESVSGIVTDPEVSTAPEATKCQFRVVSMTSMPLTLEKFVGPAGSVRYMYPPDEEASLAVNPTE
jgi:hypothetical protein